MVLSRRVMWAEGTLLRQQHFQQLSRSFDASLTATARVGQPFYWGFRQVQLDQEALRSGHVTVASCVGMFPDGAGFSVPDVDDHPPAIEIDPNTVDQTVYMILPNPAPGAVLGSPASSTGEAGTRYIVDEADIPDNLRGGAPEMPVQVGRLNLTLSVGDRPRPGYSALPIARIRSVSADRVVDLDPAFIPPVVTVSGSPVLSEHVKEIAHLLDVEADHLAGAYSQVGGQGAAALLDFLRLVTVNRYAEIFRHFRDSGANHPETVYTQLVALAGELATFNSTNRRVQGLPDYAHDDLTLCITHVVTEIKEMLGQHRVSKAVRIDLQHREDHGIFAARVDDLDLLERGQFCLMATADMPLEELRKRLPPQITIGSVARIRDLITAAVHGVPVEALPHHPPEVKYFADWVYFGLRATGPEGQQEWADIVSNRTIAIRYAERFPGLDLQLWAIRD